MTGFVAWLLWCVAHIYFLIGFRNRLSVAMNWVWSYLTFQRGTRLITGMSGSRVEEMLQPPPMGLDKAAGPAPTSNPHKQATGNTQSRLMDTVS